MINLKEIESGGSFWLPREEELNNDLNLNKNDDDDIYAKDKLGKTKIVRDGEELRFRIPRDGEEMIDCNNRNTKDPIKKEVKENGYIKKMFNASFDFREFKYYNSEYKYLKEIKSIYAGFLEEYWDDAEQIFKFCDVKRRIDFQIHHIKEVNSHFQMKNQIYYRLVVSRMKTYLWLRMEDCFSYHIFIIIRKYLIDQMQLDNSNLADSTIFHEFLIYYKRFNEMLNKNLKLSQITNISATSYRAYTRRLDLEPDTIQDVDCVTNAFLSCKNEFGVTIGKDKYKNHYEIEEFRILATKKVFKKVIEKINKGELKIIRYKKTMTTLTYENSSKSNDKSRQRQIDNYLKDRKSVV